MLDEQLQRAVAEGFLVGIEGPLAGVIALEFDARLEDQQGGGGEGDRRCRVEIALAGSGRDIMRIGSAKAGSWASRSSAARARSPSDGAVGAGLSKAAARAARMSGAGRGRAWRGAGGPGRWWSGFGWRWRRRVGSWGGLRGEGSEVGVAPDGFEFLFVGARFDARARGSCVAGRRALPGPGEYVRVVAADLEDFGGGQPGGGVAAIEERVEGLRAPGLEDVAGVADFGIEGVVEEVLQIPAELVHQVGVGLGFYWVGVGG